MTSFAARVRTTSLDGAVIELAGNGDEILTSGPRDLVSLAEHSGKTLLITPVSQVTRR